MTLSDIKARALQMLTERDNATVCPVRVILVGAIAVYHLAAVVGVCIGQMRLDMPSLGDYLQHMCLVMGAAGGSIGVKSVLRGDAQ